VKSQTEKAAGPHKAHKYTDDEDLEEEDQDEETDADVAESSLQDQVVKKLLRYALACEHQRIRITRAGITEKGMVALFIIRKKSDW